ncbi:MAG: GxxExxY protein [Desulfobacterales bacterium]|nr:GxxExxY protein [Desulfobacterales bacterium]
MRWEKDKRFTAKNAKNRQEKNMTENEIGKIVVDSSVRVHKTLGPGLLESAYEACLAFDLRKQGLKIQVQVGLPLEYEEVRLDVGYRIDILAENKVILELKAVEKILPIHKAQLLSYLKLSNCKLGFLLNFNVYRMKDGIHRMVNQL